MKYIPRNDFVLFRLVDNTVSKGGVAVPSISEEGKKRVIVAVGHEVKNLDVGDEVLIIGHKDQFGNTSVVRIPETPDLFLTPQSNVVCILRKEIDTYETILNRE